MRYTRYRDQYAGPPLYSQPIRAVLTFVYLFSIVSRSLAFNWPLVTSVPITMSQSWSTSYPDGLICTSSRRMAFIKCLRSLSSAMRYSISCWSMKPLR